VADRPQVQDRRTARNQDEVSFAGGGQRCGFGMRQR
jgi:hypothetical protein